MTSERRRTCDAVQLAIIAGCQLDEAQRRHRDGCEECRFVVELSRHFTGFGNSTGDSSALGPGVTAALAHAIASGEPVLGRYRIEALCGRGGQGAVYRATDLETGDRIALKLVRMTGDSAAELRNARRIRHPNVCGVYHAEQYGELRLISMEWIDGPTLAHSAAVGRRDALGIVQRICAGVAAAHAEGVLHLDLKPSNVLFRGAEPVITDFGLSVRVVAGEARAAGGTPRYMAPEQRGGHVVDRRTDVYALGRLAEDLITRPTRRVRRAIRRATAREPRLRYASVERFAGALAPPRRRRAVVVALAALVLAATALFVAPVPRGTRAGWDDHRWGADTIPRQAWNVARNPLGEGLPQITVEDPIWGCGQSPYELVDGSAEYESWEHGVAFLPAPSAAHPDYACVSLRLMGGCGVLNDNDRLCEFNDASAKAEYHVIAERGRDVATLPSERRARIGLAIATQPCGDRALVLHLDAAYPVFALRVWHHGKIHTPHFFKIELRDEQQQVHVVVTSQNQQATTDDEQNSPRGYATAAPVTTRFAPVMTREIRYVMNTCSMADTWDSGYLHGGFDGEIRRVPLPDPGHGWIYEVEAFALLPRWQAWWRVLEGR